MNKNLIISPRQTGKTNYALQLFFENPNHNLLILLNNYYSLINKKIRKEYKKIIPTNFISTKIRGSVNKFDTVIVDEFFFQNLPNNIVSSLYYDKIVCLGTIENVEDKEIKPFVSFIRNPENKNKDLENYSFVFNRKLFKYKDHLSPFDIDEIIFRQKFNIDQKYFNIF